MTGERPLNVGLREVAAATRLLYDQVHAGEPLAAIDCTARSHDELAIRLYQLEELADRVIETYGRQGPKDQLDELVMQLLKSGAAARRALSLAGVCASGFCHCSGCRDARKAAKAPKGTTHG